MNSERKQARGRQTKRMKNNNDRKEMRAFDGYAFAKKEGLTSFIKVYEALHKAKKLESK